MKVMFINGVSYGSTAKIMFQLADGIRKDGGESLCTAGFTKNKCQREDFFITSNLASKILHMKISEITGKHGGYSRISTKRLISKIKEFNPDIIHLNNIHGWYLNFEMFFSFLKRENKKVVWTLHDCWSFTGACPHFEISGCEKWKNGCYDCSYKGYPKTRLDVSAKEYKRKKELFTGVKNLTIVTPSEWLKSKVEESFLNSYPVTVINNGIDLDVFKFREGVNLKRYGVNSRYVVLGVSYDWDDKKGLDAFIRLSEILGDEYTVVLVGTNEKLKKQLPQNIVAIDRTQSQKELSLIYSCADVFVNPTLEDTFPTVNMESLACGTPVVTYKTGGSSEIIDETCGIAVEKGNICALEEAVKYVCMKKPFSKDQCLNRAKLYDKEIFLKKYIELYKTYKGDVI